MKKLIILALLCAPMWAQSTVTQLCTAATAASGSTVTCTTSANVPAGSAIVVIVSREYGAVQSVSVSDGTGSYTQDQRWVASGSGFGVDVFSRRTSAQLNSGSTITATVSSYANWGITAYYISSVASSYIDSAGGAGDASYGSSWVSPTTGSVSGAAICIGGFRIGASMVTTAGNGYTQLDSFDATDGRFASQYKRVTSGTTYLSLSGGTATSGVAAVQCYLEGSAPAARRRVMVIQ